MRGTFKGIEEADVDIPSFKVLYSYETVRYGTLRNFVVLIPKGSKVVKDERETSRLRKVTLVTPNGMEFVIHIKYGDAETPDDVLFEENFVRHYMRGLKF